MKKTGWFKVFLIIVWMSTCLQSGIAFSTDTAEQFSTVKFIIPPPDSDQTLTYLGLDAIKPFKVTDIKAKIVIIELMSAVCPHCQANAPTMNEIYKIIQANSSLADVKLIAIAISDDKISVEAFKKQFRTSFPILLDENHEIKSSMRGMGTPTTLVVSTGDAKVLYTHRGVIADADGFVKQVRFVKQLEALDK